MGLDTGTKQEQEYTYEVPLRNSAIIASRSFCAISPCIDETVKFAFRIFSVNQSTCHPPQVSAHSLRNHIDSPFSLCYRR